MSKLGGISLDGIFALCTLGVNAADLAPHDHVNQLLGIDKYRAKTFWFSSTYFSLSSSIKNFEKEKTLVIDEKSSADITVFRLAY